MHIQTKQLPVSCNKDCGGGCPLTAHVESGRLIRITDSPFKRPFMQGCARGYRMTDAVYSPRRLKKPLIQNGERGSGAFREASWKEALDIVAERLDEIRQKTGGHAVLPLGGSGSCIGAVHNTGLLKNRFFSLYGSCIFTDGNYSEQAMEFTSSYLFGPASTGLDPGTLQFSKLIILWGVNIAGNRFGCEMEARIRESRDRGVPVVVVDPRRRPTAERLGATWIPVRPGTDSALMLAVLFTLFKEDLIDRSAVGRLSSGFEGLERYILGDTDGIRKTPAWAEKICGTPARTIRDFAMLYGRSKPAALIPGLSFQRTMGGEEAVRLSVSLQLATGNIGVRGGSTGGNVLNKLPCPKCGNVKLEYTYNIPIVPLYIWPDAVIGGAAGGFPADIDLIYNVGGNYLSQGSDIKKNIKAFQKAAFSVCHDYFLTPTARYCDVVLPVTTFLEREDVIFPRSNYLYYSHRAVESQGEARNDYDIFCELAKRLGFLEEFSENRTAEEWVAHLLEKSEILDIGEFKRTGIYDGKDHLRTGLSDFSADPGQYPLSTPSGRIQIDFTAYGNTGFTPFPECRVLYPTKRYPLRLITPHALYRINSQNSNIDWFKNRQDNTLWIHPSDAVERGITAGMAVLVQSEKGVMHIHAEVTEDIMQGVVSAHQGVWPEFNTGGIETAGSVNVLTSTEPTKPSNGSRTHSVLVEVMAEE